MNPIKCEDFSLRLKLQLNLFVGWNIIPNEVSDLNKIP